MQQHQIKLVLKHKNEVADYIIKELNLTLHFEGSNAAPIALKVLYDNQNEVSDESLAFSTGSKDVQGSNFFEKTIKVCYIVYGLIN